MAGVGQVKLDGVIQDITAANHYEVLVNRKTCSVDGGPIDEAQIKQAEKFASQEELEEIYYSENESMDRGAESIEGVEEAESHDGQGGNVAVATAGNIAAIYGSIQLALMAWAFDGFTAIICAIGAVACAAATRAVFVPLFDAGFEDRCAALDAADSTNETIDEYTANLEGTLDSMNEDYVEYADMSNNYMLTKNDITNQIAMLTMDLESAKSGGNVQRAADLQTQIAELQGADLSAEEDGMLEISGRLDEYSSLGGEANGALEGSGSVTDFLRQGNELGAMGTVNTALLTLAAAAMGLAAVGQMPKLAPFFIDAVPSAAAKIAYAGAGLMFGLAAYAMGDKTKKEFECHDAGVDIDEHRSELGSMIETQTAFVEQTSADYAAADEASAEGQAEASEAANGAVETHNEGAAVNHGNSGDSK